MRISRVFATGLGDQNMVIEDVTIETEDLAGEAAEGHRGAGVVGAAQGVAGGPLFAVSEAVSGV